MTFDSDPTFDRSVGLRQQDCIATPLRPADDADASARSNVGPEASSHLPASSFHLPPSARADGLPAIARLTPDQERDARARVAILLAAWTALDRGETLTAAARQANTPKGTLCKLLKLAGLSPTSTPKERCHHLLRQPLEALAPGISTGRPCEAAKLLDDPAVQARLRELYVATIGASGEAMTNDRRTGSVALTLLRFADFVECPPHLAYELRRGYQPAPLCRWLAQQMTPEIEAKIRGQKAYRNHGSASRRDRTVQTPDGKRWKMPAGWMVEFDDMSINQPFFVKRPDGSVILSRQGLYARCPVSGYFMACDLIARPRESYRAEDILRFLRRLCLEFGKPAVLRMEQGIWKARSIRGASITATGLVIDEVWEVPAADPGEEALFQDGLKATGITLEYVSGSHKKGAIEQSFSYLQRVTATMTPEFVNIGRHAGEFERSAKALRRARAESHDPADLGFAPMAILADKIAEAMAWINARPDPSTGIIRNELYQAGREAAGTRPVTRRDLAAFLPDQRERQIAGGKVSAPVEGQPFDFRAAELFAQLGDGYGVAFKFDACEPTLGAAIYNREHYGSIRNSTYQVGEFIGWAEWEPPAPQLHVSHELAAGLEPADMAQYGDDPSIGARLRKRQEKWHSTQFRALPRPGQPAVKAAAARDGQNRVATAEIGTAALPGREESGGAASARSQETGVESAHRSSLRAPRSIEDMPYSMRKLLAEEELDAVPAA